MIPSPTNNPFIVRIDDHSSVTTHRLMLPYSDKLVSLSCQSNGDVALNFFQIVTAHRHHLNYADVAVYVDQRKLGLNDFTFQGTPIQLFNRGAILTRLHSKSLKSITPLLDGSGLD